MVLSEVTRKKYPVTPPEIDPGTVQLVSQRLNHYTTPEPPVRIYGRKIKNDDDNDDIIFPMHLIFYLLVFI